jgi:2-polyprenyl-6-methoxyphenol hydroxylase-like FAD-dependent oxidoreductase
MAPIASYPKTNIKVVVVGAGFGGLAAAVESKLKGHDVVVIEKTPKWEQLGDIISISKSLRCCGVLHYTM